jgi:hypothetical protein
MPKLLKRKTLALATVIAGMLALTAVALATTSDTTSSVGACPRQPAEHHRPKGCSRHTASASLTVTARAAKTSRGRRGAKGVKGVKGAKGSVGVAGLTGATGAAGATGAIGSAGSTGAQGATGPTGPASIGEAGPAGPTGSVLLYSSLDKVGDALEGVYTQPFNGPEIQYLGDEVNLASNPDGKTLGAATVSLSQFATSATGSTSCAADVALQYNWSESPTCYNADVELSLFTPGEAPGTVGAPIGEPVTTTVEVPIDPSVKFTISVSFDFSSQNLVLPGQVIYGISLPQLVPNDNGPLGALNADLASEGYDLLAGSDVDPGHIFVQAKEIGILDTNIGTCPGNTLTANTFEAVPVMCPSGYARNTPSGSGVQSGSLWMNNIPAISLSTVN